MRLSLIAAALASLVGATRLEADPEFEPAPPEEVVFRLSPEPHASGDWLGPFRDGSPDRLGPLKLYTTGPWGLWSRSSPYRLRWSLPEAVVADPKGTFASLWHSPWEAWLTYWLPLTSLDSSGINLETDGFGALFRLPPTRPAVDWRCRRRPVFISRPGGEGERFDLVKCDDTAAPFALDRLSLLARQEGAARPEELDLEPNEATWDARREWVDGVRLVHPRLLWALQRVADAHPFKPIVIYSGYRPLAEVNDRTGHRSLHATGRALDIAVGRVSNEELFKTCTTIRGVGCGFYPRNKFVHIDVRRAEPGEAFWIDDSSPGSPAEYKRDFPGLIDNGKLLWKVKPR